MKTLLLAAAAALLLGGSPVMASTWVINGQHVIIDDQYLAACVQGMERFDAERHWATNQNQDTRQCALMIYHIDRGEPVP